MLSLNSTDSTTQPSWLSSSEGGGAPVGLAVVGPADVGGGGADGLVAAVVCCVLVVCGVLVVCCALVDPDSDGGSLVLGAVAGPTPR